MKNTLIPVNRLPPEILSRVLGHHADGQTLIEATHVCRYWRSTLTSSPSLWAHLLFRSSDDVDRILTYLERSKTVLLHVSIATDSPENLEAFVCLAPHMARMRSCLIEGANINIDEVFARFRNSAPSLTCLEIRSRRALVPFHDDLPGDTRPPFGCPFPLPNLTEFHLSLYIESPALDIGTLFRFLSYSPRLQNIRIIASYDALYDNALDQVISLDSLVGLDYTSRSPDRILPRLRLPRLQRLRVSSSGSQQMPKLADLTPNGGRPLLAGATKMFYLYDPQLNWVDLSGNGVDISFAMCHSPLDPTPADWLSNQTCIPFGQIEDLAIEGWSDTLNPPIDVFENLRVLRVTLDRGLSTEGLLRSLLPQAGTPCPSLREIWYTYQGSLGPLITLVRERKRAGHQLGLVCLFTENDPDQDCEGLREHVGEVRVNENPFPLWSLFPLDPNESPSLYVMDEIN